MGSHFIFCVYCLACIGMRLNVNTSLAYKDFFIKKTLKSNQIPITPPPNFIISSYLLLLIASYFLHTTPFCYTILMFNSFNDRIV